MGTSLNSAGEKQLNSLVAGGNVDTTSSWSFGADDGNKLLGADGNDWANYGKYFLGIDSSASGNTKDHYKYPFGKDDKAYKSALDAIRSRASQEGAETVFAAAGAALDKINAKRMTLRSAAGSTHRAYSQFQIKAIDEGKRIITGIATTPTADRMGDVVEPMGAEFELPLPFLWQHDSMQPIGHVTAATPSKSGIPVTVELAQVDEPGTLRDRLEEAWQSIKIGLVRGLSIGFAPIEYSIIEETWGLHFQKWSWLELSGVTIPANADASISAIKRYDATALAALGRRKRSVVSLIKSSPGVSGKNRSIKLVREENA
jgi:HK97 family phage prohead protease